MSSAFLVLDLIGRNAGLKREGNARGFIHSGSRVGRRPKRERTGLAAGIAGAENQFRDWFDMVGELNRDAKSSRAGNVTQKRLTDIDAICRPLIFVLPHPENDFRAIV